MRLVLVAGVGLALMLGLTGCWLFMPNQPPVAAFEAQPNTGQAPLVVSFNAEDSRDPDGNITSYSWSFGDGESGVGVSGIHQYDNQGTYTAVLTVIDDDGAMATASNTITVTAPENQPPEANISAAPMSGQAPLMVAFDGTGSNDPDGSIASYDWQFGGGATGSSPTANVTYTTAGTYAVVLEVTDNDGATDTATVTITVTSPGNQAPNASFTADPEAGVAPLTVDFDATASSDPDGAIVAYQWYFGDGDTGVGATVSHTYDSFGAYTAILTVVDDDGTPASATVEISVWINLVIDWSWPEIVWP
jgi:PKD repeat protein